jgi:hypothetical protein
VIATEHESAATDAPKLRTTTTQKGPKKPCASPSSRRCLVAMLATGARDVAAADDERDLVVVADDHCT